MGTDGPRPEGTADSDALSLRLLLHFQFLVLTGLFVLGLPGRLALEGAPLSDFLPRYYGAALCMHAFFQWRLWRLAPRFRGHFLAILAVVLVVPWTGWAAKRFLGFDAAVVGAAVFVLIVVATFLVAGRGRGASG